MFQFQEKVGKVYLVGAGPGDPELLTLKAANTLRRSQAVVYDYLVNEAILNYAPAAAAFVYVGKRAGHHSKSQTEINRILIEYARRGLTVVRLKGGDPFIFGRGGEEAEALVEAGIKFEVVPGISSGIAAAAYAGIPLTHRDYSSSVAFITGHFAKDDAAVDWAATAKSAETLVVFMCAENICRIAQKLIENGRESSTPLAIIRWGTYEKQEIFTETLGALAGLSESERESLRERIMPPAIAVIGAVVSLREKLKWFGETSVETVAATASAFV